MNNAKFFLGANTPFGFKSLFDQLYDPYDDWKMYIIKGGPGTGKSSLMKGIAKDAEDEGHYVERIPCSSDPFSLDAVIIPDLKTAIADATSPHIVDPVFPGVCEQTINLGAYWNNKQLKESSNEIKRITIQNSSEHKKCIKYLKAAHVLDREAEDMISDCINYEKLERFALRTAEKELKIKNDASPSTVKKRFLSAITPQGVVVQYDTIFSLCDKIISVNDNYGVVSSMIMEILMRSAKERFYDVIACYCPMNPDKKIEHLIIPELKLGFFTSNTYHPLINKADKNIHWERFVDQSSIKSKNNKLLFIRKAKLDLIGESISKLEDAKSAHDVLESYYIAAMNFEEVSKTKDKVSAEILNR